MNLFEKLPEGPLPDEVTEVLEQRAHMRIERIVSAGQISPEGFWYDQEEDEWVLLVQGSARLELEDVGEVELHTGDYLLLPAHQKHRVSWTSTTPSCIWLCIFSA